MKVFNAYFGVKLASTSTYDSLRIRIKSKAKMQSLPLHEEGLIKMFRQLITCAVIASGVFFAVTAFAAGEDPGDHMSVSIRNSIAGGFYEGVFSDGTPFQMNLALPSAGEAIDRSADLNSEYWYPRRTEGNRLRLKVVTSTASRSIELSVPGEVEATGTQPDAVEIFTGVRSTDDSEIEGEWADRQTQKKLHFVMKRRFLYVTKSVSFVTQSAMTDFGGRRTQLTVTYPVTNMPELDNAMPSIAESSRSDRSDDDVLSGEDLEAQSSVVIAWASPDYLFLQKIYDEYDFGAAHGLGDEGFALYRITGGVPRHMTLDDFLPEGLGCRSSLSTAVVEALKQDNASMPEAGALVIERSSNKTSGTGTNKRDVARRGQSDWSNYVVMPDGFEFYFGEYSMGSYAETHDVFIPKTSLGVCGSALPVFSPSS